MTLIERLRALGQRREAEGIYTDQNICEAAIEQIGRLDAMQKILRIAERINHHNVDVAQNIARGLGDTKGLYRDYMAANFPTVGVHGRELDEAFQEYYECFKQT